MQHKKPIKSQYFCQLKWLRYTASTFTIKYLKFGQTGMDVRFDTIENRTHSPVEAPAKVF